MDLPPEVFDLGVRLAETAARNGAAAVGDRIRALRASGKAEGTIAGLEEIVNSLVDDKAELTRIAQAYQAELVSQRLASGDVQYIATTVVPLLERLADSVGGPDGVKFKQGIESIKPLLSVETANVLQILGFDFRRAIGEPLTKLTENLFLSRMNQNPALQVEAAKREQLYIQLALDAEAYARWQVLFGKG